MGSTPILLRQPAEAGSLQAKRPGEYREQPEQPDDRQGNGAKLMSAFAVA